MQSVQPTVFNGFVAPRCLTQGARPREPKPPVLAEYGVHVSSEVLADIDRRMEAALHFAARPDARSGAGSPTRTHWSRILHYDLLGVESGGGAWSQSRSFAGRIRKAIVACVEAVAVFTRRFRARRRQRREAWAAYDALRQLDDHTLRDLGFERSKLMPAVSEDVFAHGTVRQLKRSL